MSKLTIKVHEHKHLGIMGRYYGITANEYAPVMFEKLNTGAIYKRHGEHGFAMISANLSDKSAEYNEQKTKELITDLQKSDYRYLPVYGGYVGDNGIEDDYEPSFIVFPYSVKKNEFTDFEPFKKFILNMCGKYKQNSVLIVAPDGNPNYYNEKGKPVNNRSSRELTINDATKKFFTSFKDKDAVDAEVRMKLKPLYRQYVKEHPEVSFDEFMQFNRDKIKSIGRRFTMDISFPEESFKLFFNPPPKTLNERMQRDMCGEIIVCQWSKKEPGKIIMCEWLNTEG